MRSFYGCHMIIEDVRLYTVIIWLSEYDVAY